MTIYLINDAEYYAAEDEEQAKAAYLRDGHTDEAEAVEADNDIFYTDPDDKEECEQCTMLERAIARIANGDILPFHVAYSTDVL